MCITLHLVKYLEIQITTRRPIVVEVLFRRIEDSRGRLLEAWLALSVGYHGN